AQTGTPNAAANQSLTRDTLLWGCPSWEGRMKGTEAGGIDVYYTGYAMQEDPTMRANYPSPTNKTVEGSDSETPLSDRADIRGDYAAQAAGRWFKMTEWKNPS